MRGSFLELIGGYGRKRPEVQTWIIQDKWKFEVVGKTMVGFGRQGLGLWNSGNTEVDEYIPFC